MDNKRILNITWSRFHEDAKYLASKIMNSGFTYDSILCISRGGLSLSHILGIELNIKNILTVCLSSYEDKTRSKEILEIYTPPTSDILDRCLLVDDLIDSGRSIAYIESIYPNNKFTPAVLYVKGFYSSKVIHITTYSRDTWIKFPWET